jgi:hypothetical protein
MIIMMMMIMMMMRPTRRSSSLEAPKMQPQRLGLQNEMSSFFVARFFSYGLDVSFSRDRKRAAVPRCLTRFRVLTSLFFLFCSLSSSRISNNHGRGQQRRAGRQKGGGRWCR